MMYTVGYRATWKNQNTVVLCNGKSQQNIWPATHWPIHTVKYMETQPRKKYYESHTDTVKYKETQ